MLFKYSNNTCVVPAPILSSPTSPCSCRVLLLSFGNHGVGTSSLQLKVSCPDVLREYLRTSGCWSRAWHVHWLFVDTTYWRAHLNHNYYRSVTHYHAIILKPAIVVALWAWSIYIDPTLALISWWPFEHTLYTTRIYFAVWRLIEFKTSKESK